MLGADLAAAYLFGSAVLGGLRPDSDLDVLALVAAADDAWTRSGALVERLLAISGRRTARAAGAASS